VGASNSERVTWRLGDVGNGKAGEETTLAIKIIRVYVGNHSKTF